MTLLRNGEIIKNYKVAEKLDKQNYFVTSVASSKTFVLRVLENVKMSDKINLCLNLGSKSPFLIRYIEIFQKEGIIIMECYSGKDFSKRFKENRTPTDIEIFRFLFESAMALKTLHDAGIIHGSIRPSSFFLLANGGFKLGDYGLVYFPGKPLPNVDGSQYSPPEVRSGDNVKMDIYSLGVILLEYVLGCNPFTATGELLDAVIKHPHPAVQIGCQMVAADPAHRPTADGVLALPMPASALCASLNILHTEGTERERQLEQERDALKRDLDKEKALRGDMWLQKEMGEPYFGEGRVRLFICSGTIFKKHDIFTKDDPYVKVVIGGVERRTRILSGTQIPVWNEWLIFPKVQCADARKVRVEMWDGDLEYPDFIGASSAINLLPLRSGYGSGSGSNILTSSTGPGMGTSTFNPTSSSTSPSTSPFMSRSTLAPTRNSSHRTTHLTLQLFDRAGEEQATLEVDVALDVGYVKKTGVVSVIGAKIPRSHDWLTKDDAFLQVVAQGVTRRTHVVKNSQQPQWNEEFVFEDLADEAAADVQLVLSDRDRIVRNDYIGAGRLSLLSFTNLSNLPKGLDVGANGKIRYTVPLFSRKWKEEATVEVEGQMLVDRPTREETGEPYIGEARVRFKVLSGKIYRKHDLITLDDPYVKIKIGTVERKTHQVINTQTPVWNSFLVFDDVLSADAQNVTVSMFDGDVEAVYPDLIGVSAAFSVLGQHFRNANCNHNPAATPTTATSAPAAASGGGGSASSFPSSSSSSSFSPPPPPNHITLLLYDRSGEMQAVVELDASLELGLPKRSLLITAVGAHIYKSHDVLSKDDPFLEVVVDNVVRRTHFKKNTQEPLWNEDFIFEGLHDGDADNVVVSIWDYDPASAHDRLGSGRVSVLPCMYHKTTLTIPLFSVKKKRGEREEAKADIEALLVDAPTPTTKARWLQLANGPPPPPLSSSLPQQPPPQPLSSSPPQLPRLPPPPLSPSALFQRTGGAGVGAVGFGGGHAGRASTYSASFSPQKSNNKEEAFTGKEKAKITIVSGVISKSHSVVKKDDPFVKVKIGVAEKQTTILGTTQKPVWNETLVFDNFQRVDAENVCLSLWNSVSVSKADLIGSAAGLSLLKYRDDARRVSVPICDKDGKEQAKLEVDLMIDSGETPPPFILPQSPTAAAAAAAAAAGASYFGESMARPLPPFLMAFERATATFLIKEAKVARSHDIIGKGDPYVIVRFNGQVKKTTVKSNTMTPIWNETLMFEDVLMNTYDADIGMFDRDFGKADDFIGSAKCNIGLARSKCGCGGGGSGWSSGGSSSGRGSSGGGNSNKMVENAIQLHDAKGRYAATLSIEVELK